MRSPYLIGADEGLSSTASGAVRLPGAVGWAFPKSAALQSAHVRKGEGRES